MKEQNKQNDNTLIVEGILTGAEYDGKRYILSKEALDKAFADFTKDKPMKEQNKTYYICLLQDVFGNRHSFVLDSKSNDITIQKTSESQEIFHENGEPFFFENHFSRLEKTCLDAGIDFKIVEMNYNFDEILKTRELLQKILYKSNLENSWCAEDMQSNLEEIHDLIVEFDSTLEEQED